MQSWHGLSVITQVRAPHKPLASSHTQDKANAAIGCSAGNQKEKLYAL
jgi:hypothetical protein